VTRRDFLKVGVCGAAGLTLSQYLRMADAGEVKGGKAKSAIFINLAGGPSHVDSFDMKPEASDNIRGEFKPIATKTPGIAFCEHLPRLASVTDKFTILRGVTHNLAAHEFGTQYLITGNRPLPSLSFPGYGAVVAKELEGKPDLPPFVAIPSTPQSSGYLGIAYAPYSTNAEPKLGEPFSVRGISLGKGLSVSKIERRENLLAELDTAFAAHEANDSLLGGLDRFSQRAYDIIRSPSARKAFDIGAEPTELRDSFGKESFGQSCLLACRLVEAGVRFVTVTFNGWDTHYENFKRLMEKQLPVLDQGVAALLETLSTRGLLDSTTVFVTGEFGRTPKINDKRGGRDHWARSMFVLMAGGGTVGGQVIGASDSEGMGPADKGITPDDVAASFYHTLGIDFHKEYHTSTGRPVMIVRNGSVIPELFG
jgi:hypothetical protein